MLVQMVLLLTPLLGMAGGIFTDFNTSRHNHASGMSVTFYRAREPLTSSCSLSIFDTVTLCSKKTNLKRAVFSNVTVLHVSVLFRKFLNLSHRNKHSFTGSVLRSPHLNTLTSALLRYHVFILDISIYLSNGAQLLREKNNKLLPVVKHINLIELIRLVKNTIVIKFSNVQRWP